MVRRKFNSVAKEDLGEGMRRLAGLLVGLLLLACALGCRVRQGPAQRPRSAAAAVTIEVFVPCGVVGPFSTVREQFEAKHPEMRVKARIENINVLVQRVLDGATPDLLLALGDVEVDRLRRAGRLEEGSLRPLAGNYVGLIAPAGNPGQIRALEDLAKASAGQVGVAQPEENSSGGHLRQALQKLGVWEKMQERVVIARFPADVQTMVAQGKVNAGAIYGPCFMEGSEKGGRPQPGQAKGKVTYLLTVPPHLAGSFVVTAVACKGAVHRQQALAFAEFLCAAENRRAWQQWGFDPLPEADKGGA